jgi:hypothetical protein
MNENNGFTYILAIKPNFCPKPQKAFPCAKPLSINAYP